MLVENALRYLDWVFSSIMALADGRGGTCAGYLKQVVLFEFLKHAPFYLDELIGDEER